MIMTSKRDPKSDPKSKRETPKAARSAWFTVFDLLDELVAAHNAGTLIVERGGRRRRR